jgi:hypothetical protein
MKNNGTANEIETPPVRSERHVIALLTGIYLEVGLPLELAVKSAIADYDLFQEDMVCAV